MFVPVYLRRGTEEDDPESGMYLRLGRRYFTRLIQEYEGIYRLPWSWQWHRALSSILWRMQAAMNRRGDDMPLIEMQHNALWQVATALDVAGPRVQRRVNLAQEVLDLSAKVCLDCRHALALTFYDHPHLPGEWRARFLQVADYSASDLAEFEKIIAEFPRENEESRRTMR